jgi:hypothetical protein
MDFTQKYKKYIKKNIVQKGGVDDRDKLIPPSRPAAQFEINDVVRVITSESNLSKAKEYNFIGRLAEITDVTWMEEIKRYWYWIIEYSDEEHKIVKRPYSDYKLELVCKHDKRTSLKYFK